MAPPRLRRVGQRSTSDTVMDSDTLQALEGHCVSVALPDGSRIDKANLVSARRPGTKSLWLFADGLHIFVRRADVVAVWESDSRGAVA